MDIFKNEYNFLYDSYNGTKGYEPMSDYSYIIPFSREDSLDYKSRRSVNIYQNYYAPMINIYLAPIFGSNKELKTNNKNTQNLFNETELVKYSNRAVRDLKMYDLCYYGVCFEDEVTIPDIFNIEPKDVESNVIKNNQLISMEYLEYQVYKNREIPILCTYENGMLIKYTMAWLESDGSVTLEETDRRVTEFDTISDCYIWKQGTNDLNERPNSFQIALTNYDIFNKKSLVNEIMYRNAISVLVISTDQEIDAIELGANNILKVPASVNKMPEYLEISSTNFDIIESDIENSKSYLYKMFSNSLMDSNVQYTTALSTALASKSYNEEVNYLYINYQMIMNKILNKMIEYYEISTEVNISFDEINLGQVEDLETSLSNSLDI